MLLMPVSKTNCVKKLSNDGIFTFILKLSNLMFNLFKRMDSDSDYTVKLRA